MQRRRILPEGQRKYMPNSDLTKRHRHENASRRRSIVMPTLQRRIESSAPLSTFNSPTPQTKLLRQLRRRATFWPGPYLRGSVPFENSMGEWIRESRPSWRHRSAFARTAPGLIIPRQCGASGAAVSWTKFRPSPSTWGWW